MSERKMFYWQLAYLCGGAIIGGLFGVFIAHATRPGTIGAMLLGGGLCVLGGTFSLLLHFHKAKS